MRSASHQHLWFFTECWKWCEAVCYCVKYQKNVSRKKRVPTVFDFKNMMCVINIKFMLADYLFFEVKIIVVFTHYYSESKLKRLGPTNGIDQNSDEKIECQLMSDLKTNNKIKFQF